MNSTIRSFEMDILTKMPLFAAGMSIFYPLGCDRGTHFMGVNESPNLKILHGEKPKLTVYIPCQTVQVRLSKTNWIKTSELYIEINKLSLVTYAFSLIGGKIANQGPQKVGIIRFLHYRHLFICLIRLYPSLILIVSGV